MNENIESIFNLDRFFFNDRNFNFISEGTKYPLTNVYTKDTNTYIELALAGFDKDDIQVYIEDGNVVVEGEKENKEEGRKYLLKEISSRKFRKKFKLLGKEVDSVEFKQGLLRIKLKNKEPEKKLIEIK